MLPSSMLASLPCQALDMFEEVTDINIKMAYIYGSKLQSRATVMIFLKELPFGSTAEHTTVVHRDTAHALANGVALTENYPKRK